MSLDNLWVWLLIGLVAGVGARFLLRDRYTLGYVGTTFLGVLGALAGGFLGTQIGIDRLGTPDFTNYAITAAGSIMVIVLVGLIRR